ncbi:hypothetical protein PMAYCL1PPCAC_29296, partial [Pristionchus mayeri]
MSLLPDATYAISSDGLPPLHSSQLSQMQHQLDPTMQSAITQQSYMMSPPVGLPSMAFHAYSAHPSTSSPITPSPLSSPPCSAPAVPSSSAGPLKRRRFSGAKIQPTRIKKVMQSDEEIGRMVASVPVAVGRSMEHFAEKFLVAASQVVTNTGARTLAPHHLKLAMLATPHFAFLEPILREVGVPARAGEAYHYPPQATLPQADECVRMELNRCVPPTPNAPLDATPISSSAYPPMMTAELNPYAMHNPYFFSPLHQQQPFDPLTGMGQMMGGVPASLPHQSPTLVGCALSPLSSPSGTAPPTGGRR